MGRILNCYSFDTIAFGYAQVDNPIKAEETQHKVSVKAMASGYARAGNDNEQFVTLPHF